MQTDRAGVLGEAPGGTGCATVMDDANGDGIPGIFIPFHTSGKLFNRSSCRASVTATLEFFQDLGSGPR